MKKEQLECKHRFPRDHISKKKGVISLIIAVTISGLVLMIGFAMSSWIISSFNISKGYLNSIPAYYIAEIGVERTLNDVVVQGDRPGIGVYISQLASGAGYSYQFDVNILSTSPFRAKSVGKFSRAIDVSDPDLFASRSIEISWDTSW